MSNGIVKREFTPVRRLPIVHKFRGLVTTLAEGMPSLVEHIVKQDTERLKAVIQAKFDTLPEPDRTRLKEAFDDAMAGKRDA